MKSLPVSWFDLFVVLMIVAGLIVGRKRGMSSELLDLLLWLAIVFGGSQLYPPFGRLILETTGLQPSTSFVLAYLTIAVLLYVLVIVLRRGSGDKLVSADFFGGFEYYLGMVAGVLRFSCIVVFLLALMHAPRITDAELEAQIKAQNESLGAIYFPPFGSIQRTVFRDSISGQVVRQHLGFALINVDPSLSGGDREGIGRRRERELNDVMTPGGR